MNIFWRIIAVIFKSIFQILNFIRKCTLNLLLIFLGLVCIGICLQIKRIIVPLEVPNGALKVDLYGVVVDKPSARNKLSKIGYQWFGVNNDKLQENSLFDVIASLRQAKNDKKITGIILDLHNFSGADQPSLEYIGKVLQEFRESGKPIYAIGDNYSQIQYYLASYANKIYLAPQGKVDIHGMATNTFYYKSLLDKLKVQSHVFRVGIYKSAVEPFLRDNMSSAARKVDNRWIQKLWKNYLKVVASNRGMTPQELFPGAQGLLVRLRQTGGNTAQYAKENRLVDQLATRTEINEIFIKKFGWNEKIQNYNAISIYDYPIQNNHSQNGNIAVILAKGAIIDGKETPGMVGCDTIAEQIRKAHLDPNIKAIIFRVNSPGGSVTASEITHQALTAIRESGKPVVVSMSGIAASGGYWISTPANYIIASPTTLTGSIGIFGIINTIENSLDAIGIHSDGVATSPLADIRSTKILPIQAKQIMQLSIENGYRNFIELVAKSRHKTLEQINRIAQGHIWIGSDAKNNGLVDALGDFDDALVKAAELAKLKEVRLHWYEGESSFIDKVLNQIDISVFFSALQIRLPTPIVDVINAMKQPSGSLEYLNDPQNRYAICLSCGEVY